MATSVVFTFAHRPATNTRRVRLVAVDTELHKARCEDATWVHLHAPDATDVLKEFVAANADVAWIAADVDPEGAVACLCMVVHEARLTSALEAGGFDGEDRMICLARSVWRDIRVAARDEVSYENDMPSDPPPSWREAQHPLFPHQHRSVAWMRRMEASVPVDLQYSGNLHVANGWYLDTETECFTRDPSTRRATLVGGICSDATGTGKTAVVLRLIAETKGGVAAASACVPYGTRGTLLILPLNLIAQWQREMRKFFEPNQLSVCTLTQAKDLKDMTLARLCRDYDVVITTFYFLRSCRAYTEMVESALGGRTRGRAVLSAWRRRPGNTAPVLEAIQWHRIVVDEIHETFEIARDVRQLRLFESRMLWGVTATPLMDNEHLYILLEREKSHHPNLLAQVASYAVRSHTAAAANPTPALQLVRLTEEERLHLREDSDVAGVVKMCTFVDASSADDEADAREQLRVTRERERAALTARVTAHERTLAILTRAGDELEREIQAVMDRPEEVSVARAEYERHIRDVALARRRLEMERARLQDAEANARFVEERLTALRASDAAGAQGIGTKMHRIGELVLSYEGAPVILFVQWKSMVRGTRSFLRGLGVRVLLLDGNANQRAATLAEFDAGGVLLLCLEECFTGLDLPHARCVVFAHAIVGDGAKVKMLEEQAVARCFRHGHNGEARVYSFVVADCAEEQLWNETHPE